jgi:hypothetical protein
MTRARRFASVAAVLMLVAAGSCQGDEGMKVYKSEQMNEIEVAQVSDAGVLLRLDPMLESAYYLAGAVVTDTAEAVELSLIRCRIGETCPVDIAATTHPGTPDPYALTVPQTGKPIVVVYGDDSRATVWSPAG